MDTIKIVLSGNFNVPKAEIKEKLLQAGFHLSPLLHKKTILVCGAEAKERKRDEARLLGLPVVKEAYIADLLAQGELPDPSDNKYNVEAAQEASKKRKAADVGLLEKPWTSAKRRKSGHHHQPKGQVIALEGLIGIGKSTLCNKLVECFPDDCDVYREQTNEQFLQLFYSDTKKYGFALQWGMLKSRIYQLRLAQHDTKYGRHPPRQYYYWDRSMIGDYVFALWNHLLGGISKEEMNVYESEFGGSVRQIEKVPFLRDINMFVFLDDEPSRCKERVEVLRKNPSEQGIPLSYYEGLDDMHYHICMSILLKGVSKVLVMTWGQYNDPNECQEIFVKAMNGSSRLATVEVVNLDTVPARSTKDKVVYTSADAVFNFHTLLREKEEQDEIDARAAAKTVYIPQNIMTVDPKTKDVVANDFNIIFYQNAYKRVVMWHLAQRQHVAFYRV